MAMVKNLDRYRGSMLGLAVGDAIGCPVEGLKAGHIRGLYGEVSDYVDPGVAWKHKPHRWRLPGLYSDDTQQALALSDTLLKCRGFDAAYFSRLLCALAEADTGGRFGAHRGTGANFRATVRSLLAGADPTSAGMPSAGVGAMMRSAPCGLYFAGDDAATTAAAIEQGLVTHREPRALVMAALVARAVSGAVTGAWDKSRPADRAADLAAWAAEAERVVEENYVHLFPVEVMDRFGMAKKGIDLLPGLQEIPDGHMAANQIVAEANRQFPEHKITEPGQGFVMAAGLSALHVALTARDFEDAVKKAVNLGKDTDTMGAIVGAIMGARLGEDAIPARWIAGLVNAEQVALRGEALAAGEAAGLAIKGLVAMEAALTSREVAEREAFIAKMEARGEVRPPGGRKSKKPAVVVEDAVPDPKLRSRDGKKKDKRRRVKAPWKR